MKFTTKFVAITLNERAYLQALLRYLEQINEKAGQAWLNAAVNLTPIPTWSGASRATFVKLAAELGTSVPIGPLRTKSRVALGMGSSAGSGVVANKSKGIVGFVYATNLRYLAFNESNHATPGPPPRPFSNNVRFTPYNFQSRAQAAWLAVSKTAKLPNPFAYLSKRKI